MMALYGAELDNNFQHALQLLDTKEDTGDRYTVIDMGVHTVMEQPLFILAEDDRDELATYPAYTSHTALEDRVDVRIEPYTVNDRTRDELGDWYGRLEFDILKDDARRAYRHKYAVNGKNAGPTARSVGHLFSNDASWYTPDNSMIDEFDAYLDDRDQDDFPEL